MRWGAEFWMRIGIALFFFGLVVAAPMILSLSPSHWCSRSF